MTDMQGMGRAFHLVARPMPPRRELAAFLLALWPIGHSLCGIGLPSGQYSHHEPHHSLLPSSGQHPPEYRRLVVECDSSPCVFGVNSRRQRLKQLATFKRKLPPDLQEPGSGAKAPTIQPAKIAMACYRYRRCPLRGFSRSNPELFKRIQSRQINQGVP